MNYYLTKYLALILIQCFQILNRFQLIKSPRIKKNKIPTIDAEQIQADQEQAGVFLNMFATELRRPGTKIISSMQTCMSGVLGKI